MKGKVTIRPEDHQALCDVNHCLLAPDDSDIGWKVADFVKSDGSAFAGPAAPGAPIKFE